jgi:hypothetical protein
MLGFSGDGALETDPELPPRIPMKSRKLVIHKILLW